MGIDLNCVKLYFKNSLLIKIFKEILKMYIKPMPFNF